MRVILWATAIKRRLKKLEGLSSGPRATRRRKKHGREMRRGVGRSRDAVVYIKVRKISVSIHQRG
jgi:hypothetical protein